ncbi:MAG: hypothetical protein JWO98_4402 [Frankiales bacterium]|nr:hypothetical protein [Frankiales bacterium]
MAALSRRTAFAGALWNVAAMVFPLVSTLLLSVVIGRHLGSAVLGEQSVIAYLGGLVGTLVVMAATNCTTQVLAAAAGADDPGRFASVARLTRRVHLVGGLVACAVLATIGSGRDMAWAWVLIGLVSLIDALGWAHASRLIALEGWRAVSPLRLVSQIAGTLLGVGAVLLGGGLPAVFAAQVLSSTWLTLTLRRRDRRHRPGLDAAPGPLELRPLARLWSLFALGALLTQVVNKRIELVFLDAFSSAHDVAVYAVAFTVISVAVTVPSSLVGAAQPAVTAAAGAAGSEAELHGHLQRAARLAIVAGFVFTAGLVALGPVLVTTLWGAQFAETGRIVPWLAVAMLGTPLAVLLDVYWTAVNRLRVVLVTGAVSAVIDVGLAAALVPSFGVPGAVAANVAGQLAWLAGLLLSSRRIPGLLPPAAFLLRCVGVLVTLGGAAWGATALLAPAGPLVSLAGGGIAFLAVLAALGRTVGLLTGPDIEWLDGLLPAFARPALDAMGGIAWARSVRSRPAVERVPAPTA